MKSHFEGQRNKCIYAIRKINVSHSNARAAMQLQLRARSYKCQKKNNH